MISLPLRAKLLPELHKAGARLPADEREAKDVVNAAIAQEPRSIVHCVARPGWQVDKDGTLRFSYGNKLIGPPAKNIAPPFDAQTSRAIWQGYQRVASGVAAQGRSHGKEVAGCDPADLRRFCRTALAVRGDNELRAQRSLRSEEGQVASAQRGWFGYRPGT